MTNYRVKVTREGKWWRVSIPGLDGLTQARRIGETEQMAREFIAVTTGTPIEGVAVDVTIDVPGVEDAGDRADEIRRERAEATAIEARAVAESKQLAKELAAKNIPVRDIGEILGVTFQRASQLVNS
ncbi:HicB family toxin-antitoxin system [Rhodococcus xishaensis]|uniref:HicB family toxin-antitoxin system n=1 Tax=Rhodococcus xishaensis TaxID=2487364 RepID=A0A438AW01_9NOCA|nr:HicB family toxin-antitoxin system [Rhodococcus xishaensis]RVW02886.1 HicB family toxin-antitoxin system [Rhodococcus xishaensis]